VVRKAVESTAAEFDEPVDELPEESEGSEASPFRRPGRAGSAVGRAVHATLQLLDLRQPQHVAELARQQCAAEAIVELAGNVERLVQVALQSDAIRLAAAHPHHKELYVAAPVGRRVVEGYVDLLIETPVGLVVVDYKTDAVHDEAEIDARLEHYELQGAAYVAALEAVTGRSVVECRFVFLRPNGAVERRIRDLAGSRRRLLAVLGEESP
jgi:ATP-dependent helicase/nuclease subunit A